MKNQKRIDSEKLVERKLVEGVKQKCGMCIKLTTMIGLPDRLCIFHGGIAQFVELKTTGEEPRKVQLYIHKKLRQMGFKVFVIDSVAGVNQFLEQVDNANRE